MNDVRQGIRAGCSLEVTLKFADYANIKPSFWAGYEESWDASEADLLSEEEIKNKIKFWQDTCREICEQQIDKDIFDVKEIKVFEQVNLLKKRGK